MVYRPLKDKRDLLINHVWLVWTIQISEIHWTRSFHLWNICFGPQIRWVHWSLPSLAKKTCFIPNILWDIMHHTGYTCKCNAPNLFFMIFICPTSISSPEISDFNILLILLILSSVGRFLSIHGINNCDKRSKKNIKLHLRLKRELAGVCLLRSGEGVTVWQSQCQSSAIKVWLFW